MFSKYFTFIPLSNKLKHYKNTGKFFLCFFRSSQSFTPKGQSLYPSFLFCFFLKEKRCVSCFSVLLYFKMNNVFMKQQKKPVKNCLRARGDLRLFFVLPVIKQQPVSSYYILSLLIFFHLSCFLSIAVGNTNSDLVFFFTLFKKDPITTKLSDYCLLILFACVF